MGYAISYEFIASLHDIKSAKWAFTNDKSYGKSLLTSMFLAFGRNSNLLYAIRDTLCQASNAGSVSRPLICNISLIVCQLCGISVVDMFALCFNAVFMNSLKLLIFSLKLLKISLLNVSSSQISVSTFSMFYHSQVWLYRSFQHVATFKQWARAGPDLALLVRWLTLEPPQGSKVGNFEMMDRPRPFQIVLKHSFWSARSWTGSCSCGPKV